MKVHCSTPNSGHTDATYPLKDSSFTVGDVQGSSGNYTCVVTVQAAQYVTAYGNGHTLAGANESPKTITLKHDGTKWTVQTVTPIVFNVVCNTAPAQPTCLLYTSRSSVVFLPRFFSLKNGKYIQYSSIFQTLNWNKNPG